MPGRLTFGRISDRKIIELAEGLFSAFTSGTVQIHVGDRIAISMTKTDGQTTDPNESEESYRKLLGASTFLITQMTWLTSGKTYRVTYFRSKVWGLNPQGGEVWVPSSNPYVDGLEFHGSEEHLDSVLRIIKQHISMAPPVIAGVDGEAALAQTNAMLSRLGDAIATLVEHTSDRQKDLDKTRASLSKEAEKEIRERKIELNHEIDTIKKELESRQEKLSERELELDDRENTHVRREFAKEMAKLSDTRLSSNLLSRSMISFLIPIAIASIPSILLAILISYEIRYINAFSENINAITRDGVLGTENKTFLISNINAQILYAQIRIGLQALGIAALVWFTLRLASSRYRLVSGWERDLHRFRLDTERAGFLVEGDLEARKVNDQGLPEVLLESFSRGLFAGGDSAQTDSHEERLGGTLNAILAQAAKVRFGPDGVNVEVEGRGLRRAQRDLESRE